MLLASIILSNVNDYDTLNCDCITINGTYYSILQMNVESLLYESIHTINRVDIFWIFLEFLVMGCLLISSNT